MLFVVKAGERGDGALQPDRLAQHHHSQSENKHSSKDRIKQEKVGNNIKYKYSRVSSNNVFGSSLQLFSKERKKTSLQRVRSKEFDAHVSIK